MLCVPYFIDLYVILAALQRKDRVQTPQLPRAEDGARRPLQLQPASQSSGHCQPSHELLLRCRRAGAAPRAAELQPERRGGCRRAGARLAGGALADSLRRRQRLAIALRQLRRADLLGGVLLRRRDLRRCEVHHALRAPVVLDRARRLAELAERLPQPRALMRGQAFAHAGSKAVAKRWQSGGKEKQSRAVA